MTRHGAAFVLAALVPVMGFAQSQPNSAIPWLTESLTAPVEQSLPQTGLPVSSRIGTISVETLSEQPQDGIGLLDSVATGFPANLWRGASGLRVRKLIHSTRYGGVPANRALFRRILLAQTDPPAGKTESAKTLIARIDRLLEIGALEQAAALIAKAEPNSPELFRRWFDTGLLTGASQDVCATLTASPSLSPSRGVQVFCLAQSESWDAAATTLTLGEQLGQISANEADLLSFYLDEALLEEMEPPPFGKPLTPLEFLIRESVGLPRPGFPIPIAFLHVDLSEFIPLRFRMEAGERLAGAGVIPASVLFATYREEAPAASGGVWERTAATQAMDAATTGDEIAKALIYLDRELSREGLRYATAQEYTLYLSELPPDQLPAPVHDLIAIYLLLGNASELAENWITHKSSASLKIALEISKATFVGTYPALAPFQTTTPEALLNEEFANLIALGKTGEALLAATDMLARDALEPDDLEQALALLLSLGQVESARDIALQTLLLPLPAPDANALD